MTTQEMVNQANEILKIRGDYEKWIGMQIQNYCNQNGLDYNNAKDYSMAAIKLQKTTRPLSPYDAGLLYRILDYQKTDEATPRVIDGYDNSPQFSDEDQNTLKSMYGEWKELERGFKNILHNPNALKNQRHEIEREIKEEKKELTDKAGNAAVNIAKNRLISMLNAATQRYDEIYQQTHSADQASVAGEKLFRDSFNDMKRLLLFLRIQILSEPSLVISKN